MKNITTLLFLFLLLSSGSSSQSLSPSVIASSGNHFSATGVSLSWTIGEPVIETLGGSSVQLTQGFHQPLLIIDNVTETEKPSFAIYPNPSNGILNFDSNNESPFTVSVYTIEGKLLTAQQIQNMQMDVSFLSSGLYILKVNSAESEFTFRLIKN